MLARDLIDQKLDDRYRVLRELTHSDGSTLYEGEQTGDGARVTLQVLDRELSKDDEVSRSFLETGRALTQTAHDHLVPVVGVGCANSHICYIALETTHGTSLARLLRRETLMVSQACDVAVQVLAGLHAAHAAGVVHGRLTTSDILIRGESLDDPRVQLSGFGLARCRPTSVHPSDLQSLAPECDDRGAQEPRADVFSVAAILFEMLGGCPPFEGGSVRDVRRAARAGEYRPLTALRPDLPDALVSLVEQGLAHDPTRRPPSAAEFARRLVEFGRSPSLPDPTRRHWRSPLPASIEPGDSERPTVRAPPSVGVERSDTIGPALSWRCSSAVPECETAPTSELWQVTNSMLVSPRIPRAARPPTLDASLPVRDWARTSIEPATLRAPSKAPRHHALWALVVGASVGALLSWIAGIW